MKDFIKQIRPKHFTYVLITFVVLLALYYFYKKLIRRFTNEKSIKTGSFITIKVVKVGDGDGFKGMHVPILRSGEIKKNGKIRKDLPLLSFRLAGIDAPEMRCFNKPEQPFSRQAKDFLGALILFKTVKCEVLGLDTYGRLLVVVFLSRWFNYTNVNLIMLQTGMACVYDRSNAKYGIYKKKMLSAEKEAKDLSLGIWGLSNFILPMDYKLKYKI